MPKESLILMTKLKAPQLKDKIILREHLIKLLMDNSDRKLVIICADAGYGKTTLLAQYCRTLTVPYIFYDLDLGDNHIATFFSYLIKGFQQYVPDFGKDLVPLLSETRDFDTVMGTFINEFMENIEQEFFIILDDYHHLQHNVELAKYLEYLLRHMPSNLHLIIASRSRVPINLAYYSSKQELLLVEKEHLRFKEDEIWSLFNNVYELKIPDVEIKKIVEHSAGWITAVQLILQKIATSDRSQASETINDYVVSGGEIFDYFAREILEAHDQSRRDFLIRSSILETINPELTNHILGIRNARQMLDYLFHENVFVSRVGGDYKYHPLFRDFLNQQLRKFYPNSKILVLHKKLGNYYHEHNNHRQSVVHFLEAEDYKHACEIMTDHFSFWYNNGAHEAYLQLLDRFPASELARFPILGVKRLRCIFALGYNNVVVANVPVVLRQLRKMKIRDGEAELLLMMSALHLLRREYRKSLRCIISARKFIRSNDWHRVVEAHGRLAAIYITTLAFDKARKHLDIAMKAARRSRNPGLETPVLSTTANYHFNQAVYDKAYAIYCMLLQNYSEYLMPLQRIRLNWACALVAIHSGNYDKVWDYFAAADNLAYQYRNRPAIMDLEYFKAIVLTAEGRYQESMSALARTREICRSLNLIYPEYNALLALADLHLRRGEDRLARDMLVKAEKVKPDSLGYDSIVEHASLKMTLNLREQKYDLALRELNILRKIIKPTRLAHGRMMLSIYEATYHLATGEKAGALERLSLALEIAEAKGYESFYIMNEPYMLKFFELAIENKLHVAYVTRLLMLFRCSEARELLRKIQVLGGKTDLECRFFGPFRIRNARGQDIPIVWRTKKAKALFAWLVYQGEKGCLKDQLIDEFWKNTALDEAVHSLQVEVSYLRSMLGGLLTGNTPVKKTIMFVNQKYHLNAEITIKTDLREFNELLEMMKKENAQERLITLYESAYKLPAEDFCPDISDRWCEEPRAYYKEERLKIARALGDHYFKEKKYRESLKYWCSAQRCDPYDAEIHIAIMRNLRELREKKAAAQQYHTFVASLKEIGDDDPPRESTAIFEWASSLPER